MAREQIALNPGDTVFAFESILERVKCLTESGDCNPLSILHGLALSVVSLVSSAEKDKELAFAFYVAVLNDEIDRVELNAKTYRHFVESLSLRSRRGTPVVNLSSEIVIRG